ncbi:MAG: hypothetical protein AVDCRST_MAG64-3645, partial [uncultured Phycisphaerae bacterium]
ARRHPQPQAAVPQGRAVPDWRAAGRRGHPAGAPVVEGGRPAVGGRLVLLPGVLLRVLRGGALRRPGLPVRRAGVVRRVPDPPTADAARSASGRRGWSDRGCGGRRPAASGSHRRLL